MDGFNSPIQGYNGWNVNQSYMTPSYMANFRPSYGTDGARENPFSAGHTMGESAALLGPKDYSYGADALSETSAHMYNITTGVGDSAAWGLQNVAVPVAAWYGVSKFDKFAGRGTSASGRFGGRMASGATRAVTGGLGRAAGAMGMGRLAGSLGGAAGGMASAAGTAGTFAGGVFLPIMAASAIAGGVDSMMMDPYVSTRRGMDAMRANTANQFISGAGQAESGGFGMSATRAQHISQALTEAGQADFSLSGGQYNEIADNMMRAGIFQEVGDMDTTKIVDGVKKATSVLKLISRVTGDPDIMNGIQTLATLKTGGLDDVQKMEAAVHRIRQSSGASGISMDQLMDTIGNQGQVMAQQQGLTGVTGLLASTDAFAGFTNARRAGLISGGQMQSMGGAEGMTQSLMQGAYQTMNSGYGRMVMQGRSQIGTGYTGAISRFGTMFSGDPIASQGEWYANQGTYKEQMMRDHSPDQIMLESLRAQAKAMGQDPSDGMVIMAMAQAQGLDPASARSMAEADRARQDPLSRMRLGEAHRASNRSDYASMLQQEGLGLRGVPVLGAAQEIWKQGSRATLQAGAEFMSPVTEGLAYMSDAWESTMTGVKGVELDADRSFLVGTGGTKFEAKFEGFEKRTNVTDINKGPTDYLKKTTKHDEFINKLNSLMSDASPGTRKSTREALGMLSSGDTKGFMDFYKGMSRSNKRFMTGSNLESVHLADASNVGDMISEGLIQGRKVSESLDKPLSSSNRLAREISTALRGDYAEEDIDNIVSSRDTNDPELLKTLGLKESDLKGDVNQRRKMLLDKAMDWRNRDIEDIEGTNTTSAKQEFFRKYTEEEGFTVDQIKAWQSKSTRSWDTILREVNPRIEDATKNYHKIVEEIEANNSSQGREDKNGGLTDWSNLRDVTDGIGKLGPVMTDNTKSIEANTKALNDNLNAMKGNSPSISDPLGVMSPLINSVKSWGSS